MKSPIILGTFVALWFVGILVGFYHWEQYEATPGAVGTLPEAVESVPPGCWRLLFFAHPHCPCTRNGLSELAAIQRSYPALVVHIYFVLPPGVTAGWEQGRNWNSATQIPGVAVDIDQGGMMAHRYGAETSGFSVLIAPNGSIVFRGGLTPGRGRNGDNPGRHAVQQWLDGQLAAHEAPVYGCAIFTPNE
ncbi:MAG: hypothetical protein RMJ56_07255 [Gemmataceae bacterium]|nr:hypothetical protein [Gemmata sp.]MDW8197388.1 hypothetical protein [Gemmataceae bacterium]